MTTDAGTQPRTRPTKAEEIRSRASPKRQLFRGHHKSLPNAALLEWLLKKRKEVGTILENSKAGTGDSLGNGTLEEKKKWWNSNASTDFLTDVIYPMMKESNKAGEVLKFAIGFLAVVQGFIECKFSIEQLKDFR